MATKKHIGQGFDDFLQEEGIYEQVQVNALKKTVAHQIKNMMEEQRIRKTEMAARMKTSRSSLERLLNEQSYNVTLSTISKAAAGLGKRIELSLTDGNITINK
jgi:DNA-binding Xre family transcriptional regulator